MSRSRCDRPASSTTPTARSRGIEIWGSFCDLAMAGGPPHKGALLEPGNEGGDRRAVRSLRRGRRGDLPRHQDGDRPARVSSPRLPAGSASRVRRRDGRLAAARHRHGERRGSPPRRDARTAGVRRTSASRRKSRTSSPSSPRPATTGWATCPRDQQQAIAELFVTMAGESPLIEPDLSSPDSDERAASWPRASLTDPASTGLQRSNHRYPGWLGLECPSVRAAVWMMRALVASNVLSRREGTVLFVPVNPATDPRGVNVAGAVERVYRCAAARGIGPVTESSSAVRNGTGTPG